MENPLPEPKRIPFSNLRRGESFIRSIGGCACIKLGPTSYYVIEPNDFMEVVIPSEFIVHRIMIIHVGYKYN